MHRRKIIAGAIIIVSVGFSLWSLFSSDTLKGASASIVGREPVGATSPSLQFVTSGAQPSARGGTVLGEIATPDMKNLTDSLIDSYLSTMKTKNPSGPTNGKVTVPSGNTVASLIEDGAQGGIPFSRFTEHDIRTSDDVSPAAQKQYLESLDASVTKRFSPIGKTIFDALNEMNEKNDLATLNSITAAISGCINDTLALQVPRTLSTTHIDLLNLWQDKLVTYQAISQFADDPYKAYIALKHISPLVDADTQMRERLTSLYDGVRK